jgi:hypothetical protein
LRYAAHAGDLEFLAVGRAVGVEDAAVNVGIDILRVAPVAPQHHDAVVDRIERGRGIALGTLGMRNRNVGGQGRSTAVHDPAIDVEARRFAIPEVVPGQEKAVAIGIVGDRRPVLHGDSLGDREIDSRGGGAALGHAAAERHYRHKCKNRTHCRYLLE